MKNAELKYLGFLNKNYCFQDSQDCTVRFSGVRADLIHEFDMRGNANVNTWFVVSYFSTYDGDNESKLISELTVIPKDRNDEKRTS